MRFKPQGNGAAEESLKGYKVLRVGDIAYEGHTSKAFSFGRFVLNDIGDGIMSPRFTTLRPIKQMDIYFWKQFIIYEPIMKHILVKSTKLGTMMNELVLDDFFKCEISIPSDQEQKQIGAFFHTLDQIINLHQHELDLLNKQKKVLLQKMFPQKGKAAPEIRFSNFTDDWEQRKLGDLVKVTTGKAFRSTDFSENGEFLVVTNKNIQDSEKGIVSLGDRIDIPNQAELEKYRLNGENILVTMDGVNIGKTGLYSDSQAVIAQRVGRLSGGQILFVYQLTKKDDFLDSMNKISVGNAIKHISLAQIANYTALVPKQEQEQQQIGAFFKQLDHTITLHQRKLENLKKLKKSFLEKMFI